MPPKKSFTLLFIIAVCCLLLHAYYYYPFVADDSFISFRYVDRFLEGRGLTWTDGKPVEGYSNLLWVLVLAFIKKITGGELWKIALGLSLACTVITLWLLLKITARLTDYNKTALAWSSALFVVSAPVAIWINGGLEAPLVMVLLAAGTAQLLVPGLATGKVITAGIFLGLLALTRPDGVLFTWAISLGLVFFYAISRQQQGNSVPANWFKTIMNVIVTWFKPLFLLNLVVLLFYAGQLIYRLHYYGEWVPNTALVKIGFTKTRIIKGSIYAARMLGVYLPFMVLALLVIRKNNTRYKAVLALLATVIFIPSLYLAMIGGDIFPGYRHVLPLIPLLCAGCGIVVMLARERWLAASTLFVYYSLSIIVLALVFAIQFKDRHSRDAKYERWEWNAMAIGQTIGKGFSAPQPLMATTAAGALPYYAALPALDMLGLNDYYLPRHPPKSFGTGFLGHELGDVHYYLQQSPDIFFFAGLGSPAPLFDAETLLFNDSTFNKNYRRVKLYYHLDYALPFAAADEGHAVKLDKFCYMYIKNNSTKIGIRPGEGNQLVVPGYFLKNRSVPDSSGTAWLDTGGEMATYIAPGETWFLPDAVVHTVLQKNSLRSFTGHAVVLSNDSLRFSDRENNIEIYNPGNNKVALKELRLSW